MSFGNTAQRTCKTNLILFHPVSSLFDALSWQVMIVTTDHNNCYTKSIRESLYPAAGKSLNSILEQREIYQSGVAYNLKVLNIIGVFMQNIQEKLLIPTMQNYLIRLYCGMKVVVRTFKNKSFNFYSRPFKEPYIFSKTSADNWPGREEVRKKHNNFL